METRRLHELCAGAVVALLVTAAGCRSEAESGGAGAAPAAQALAGEGGAEAAGSPGAAEAADRAGAAAEGGATAADPSLSGGTPQDLRLSGSARGTIKDAGRGTGDVTGCMKARSHFMVHLEGPLDGKVPYAVNISVIGGYEGPRTYPVPRQVNLQAGVGVFINPIDDEEAMGLISYDGTVTVNADERSGSVNVQLKGGFGRPERARLQGTWACPPARAL